MEVKKNGGDVAKMRADENMKAEPEAGDSATSTEESEEE